MTINTICHSAWILILVLIVSERGKAALNIKPTNATVLLNGSTFFNCSTFNFSSNSEDIVWYHYSVGSDIRNDVYDDEVFTNYKNRFRGETDLSKGVVNLIVEAPTLDDAGTYECQDKKGFGESARAQLIVLETEIICQSNMHPDGVIGSNDCGIPPDQLEMSCSIAYRGNNPVQLEWRNGLENNMSSPTVECNNTTTRSTCNLNVTGDHARNNSVYICQTKNTGARVYSCSSDVIRILYAKNNNTTISKTNQEEFRCSANSSQHCSYIWYSDGKMISESESLKPKRSGVHVCQANCKMRGQTCLVIAGNFNVSVATTPEETSKAGLIAGVLLAIVAIIIIALVVWWCLCKKRNDNENRAKDDKVQVPLQITLKKDSNTDEVDSVVPVEYDIKKAFDKLPYVGKGLNGDIKGPGKYKDIDVHCAFEQIMYSVNQRTPANEGKMKIEHIVFRNCRQWMELDHDNLIKFYDIVLKPSVVFIVKEYAEGRSVRNALKKCRESKVNLPMPVVLDWATQIAQGMNYLHEKNIVHKGLKCAQVLIMEPFDPLANAPVTLKVSSYSLTSDIETSNQLTFEGMFAWLAPEAILESNYSIYSDIWSYGVTVWEILTTEIPFNNYKAGQIMKGISSGTLSLKTPDTCPQALHDIIKECFDLQPDRRPTFSYILARLRSLRGVH